MRRPLLEALDRISTGLPNQLNQLLLQGAGHFSFTDAALFLRDQTGRNNSAIGAIDPELAHRITGKVLLAFFDSALKGSAELTLGDVVAAHPELQTR